MEISKEFRDVAEAWSRILGFFGLFNGSNCESEKVSFHRIFFHFTIHHKK
jgi:hypothetical protein